jgi:predicted enzyme related to lactoylglutathione lyase
MGEMIMIATMLDILIRYGYGLANRDVTWDCQIVTNQEQMAPSPFRDRAVSYLEVPATDIAQSSTFYRQVFGWAVSGDAEQGSFTDGSGHVIGHWRSDLEVAGDQGIRPHIYVSNLSQVIDEVAAHGGTVVQPRYTEGDLWVARFSDPAGNIIGVWQQIPSSVEPDN